MKSRNKILSEDLKKLMEWRRGQKAKKKKTENFLRAIKFNFEQVMRLQKFRIRSGENLLSKIVYKLMINQSINFCEIEQKFKQKIKEISLKKICLDDKLSTKIFKNQPDEYFQKKLDDVKFFDFEKLDKAYKRLSEAMLSKGFELSESDISDFAGTQKSSGLMKSFWSRRQSVIQEKEFLDETSSLNDSVEVNLNTENLQFNSMILKDLESENFNLSTRESSITGIIENISDMKSKLESPSIVHNAKSSHMEHLIESVRGLVEVLKITAKNLVNVKNETGRKDFNEEKSREIHSDSRSFNVYY